VRGKLLAGFKNPNGKTNISCGRSAGAPQNQRPKAEKKRARTQSSGGSKENTSGRENRNRSTRPAENPNEAQNIS
jgi:hypothetical protein